MWWGSSTGRGGGRKVLAHPRKSVFVGLEGRNLGCPGNFARMSQTLGVFGKFLPKKFVRIFRSLLTTYEKRL